MSDPEPFGGGASVTEMILDRSTSRGRPDRGSSIRPSIPSASYLARHAVTVGRDTPTGRRSRCYSPHQRPTK